MQTLKSKGKIYEFDPVIYPRLLWVVRGTSKFVKEHFRKKGGDEFSKEDINMRYADRWTCIVERKKDDRLGILIIMGSGLTMGGIAHECWHAVTAFISEINADIPDYDDGAQEEYPAYLMGWLFDCCWKVKQGKAK